MALVITETRTEPPCHLSICTTALTDPSEALAPTLSPLEFQHTSNIPPGPVRSDPE